MKILTLTTSFPVNEKDTQGNFVAGLVEAISRHGHSITVLAPHVKNAKRTEKLDNIIIKRFQYAPSRLERVAYGYGIINNLKHSLLAKLELPQFMLVFFISGTREAKKVDILHANWTISGLIAVLIKIFVKKPVVLTVHGSDLEKIPSFINNFILKRVDQVIAVSSHLSKKAIELGVTPEKVVVIPNGILEIDKYLELPTKTKSDHKILAIGRLSEEKNFEYLINEFALVKELIPKATLTIIGDGPERQSLEKLSNNQNLGVKLVGKKLREEIFAYLQDADIFVMPSKREGFGLVLAEAMAAGKPSVVAKTSGLLDIANEYNSVPCNTNKGNFAQAILDLLENKNKRFEIGKAARIYARNNYDYQKISNKVTEVYNKLT